MIKTRLTDLFGIEHPIVQGGMQWVSRAELVAAVSNAGALGILSALSFPPEDLRLEIRKTKSLTDRPFGVNLTLLPVVRSVDYNEYINIIVSEGVKIVETAGRSPEPYMGNFKQAGIKVIHKCTAVRFAVTAEKIGCDVVSIDGFECGGHPGEEDITSLVLIPLAADAVKIPVIGSGGFGDARGLVAALALGADGINMGTMMLATQEAPLHPRVKRRLIEATERDTVLLLRSMRNSMRVLHNSVAGKVLEMEKAGSRFEDMAPLVRGERGRELQETGDMERGLLVCGEIVGLVRNILPVKELIDTVISEAERIIGDRLPGFLVK